MEFPLYGFRNGNKEKRVNMFPKLNKTSLFIIMFIISPDEK